jgi:adenine-specific DNA-methyltransferase
MDEVFGRANFVTSLAWQQRTTRENRKTFSNNHEYILVYASDYSRFATIRNDLDLTDEVRSRYKNPDNDPRGPWQSVSVNAQAGHGTATQFYTLVAPNGIRHELPHGRCWLYTQARMAEEIGKNNIWFGKDGKGVPRVKKFLSEAKSGLTPETLWFADDVGTNDFAKKHLVELFRDSELFDTPKPESLVARAVHIATNPNDIVLDSFLGSGTTAAVAHKMGRRWVGVEMGDHAETHCAARLRKVIDGEQGGISKDVNWQGGGGFRFCRLGEPVFDGYGSIRPGVGFADLARWVWYREIRQPLAEAPATPLLGVHQGTAYYLLFNGILGDRRPEGGNVLTAQLLDVLAPHDGPRVVFGEACRLHESKLTALNLRFRQLPYQANA